MDIYTITVTCFSNSLISASIMMVLLLFHKWLLWFIPLTQDPCNSALCWCVPEVSYSEVVSPSALFPSLLDRSFVPYNFLHLISSWWWRLLTCSHYPLHFLWTHSSSWGLIMSECWQWVVLCTSYSPVQEMRVWCYHWLLSSGYCQQDLFLMSL